MEDVASIVDKATENRGLLNHSAPNMTSVSQMAQPQMNEVGSAGTKNNLFTPQKTNTVLIVGVVLMIVSVIVALVTQIL